MLPLRDDWLIRPLFYITSPEQKLQGLAQAIFKYSQEVVIKNIFPGVFKLTPSNFVLLATHFLICSDIAPTDKQSQVVILNQTSKSFISNLICEINNSQSSLDFTVSPWLLKTYPAIFETQRFIDSLQKWLNENSIDQCVELYQIIILTILSSNFRVVEQKRVFLSDIQEILPCLIRWEIETKSKNDDDRFA
jgi:hypothetical protein